MKVKEEESEKVGLKLNIQKTKIMTSDPITSWQIYGETVETVADFIFLGSKITADGECSHEIERCLLLGRKVMTNLDSIWHPTPVLLPGNSHGRRSLVGCSPWGRWELDMTQWLHFHFSLSCTGEENGNPLQCSCLENPRDGGTWWAGIYGVAQSRTRLKRLSSSSSSSSTYTHIIYIFMYIFTQSININILKSAEYSENSIEKFMNEF